LADYLMSLKEGDVTYSIIFKHFVEAISRREDGEYPYPPGMAAFNACAFIEKIVWKNPKCFLGV
jgi:hypothetical protein